MITFEKIEFSNTEAFITLAKWDNDDEIKHLTRPNFQEGELVDVTPEELREGLFNNVNKYGYLILDDEVAVGYVTIDMDFSMLIKKEVKTAWIGIGIGEATSRGKGVGIFAMQFLEKQCRELGAKRIELGVFSFNHRAKSLYEKMGYQAFAKIENFVYYDGNWYSDVRMEKNLV